MNVKQYDSKSRINKELAMSVLFLFALMLLLPLSLQVSAGQVPKEYNKEATEKLQSVFHASSKARIDEVTRLIQESADVNVADSSGWTPLMYASNHISNPDILRVLIEHGADVNISYNGWTPLIIATSCYYPNSAVIRILLENSADINIKRVGKTALDYLEGNPWLPFHRERRVADDVNLDIYHPWNKPEQFTHLDFPASLRISSDYPKLDGATSAYPIYTATANETYEISDKEELKQYIACSRTEEA
ncbi:MAG: ankyrin repeat domain-containing protein, partial [Synergistaceae bacterium]|nr:ankyrin repeat domain-containing protein [Synergistaceae bacterium]